MLHIKPLSYDQASEQIKFQYTDIQKTLAVEMVPVMFQYIANYNAYFSYIWEQIKANITSHSFITLYQDVVTFAHTAIREIYHPSPAMLAFITEIPLSEKDSMREQAEKLEIINAKLVLITIGIREALKGINIGLQLPSTQHQSSYTAVLDELFQQPIQTVSSIQQSPASLMLAPLFGSQSLIVSQYPKFFALIAEDMTQLVKTEAYLQKRVLIEQQGVMSVERFTSPLSCSYAELLDLVAGQAHFDELLYLLVDTFPTQFPRLLLISALMKYVVGYSPSRDIVKK